MNLVWIIPLVVAGLLVLAVLLYYFIRIANSVIRFIDRH